MPYNMGVCLLMTISRGSLMAKGVFDSNCTMINEAKDILGGDEADAAIMQDEEEQREADLIEDVKM